MYQSFRGTYLARNINKSQFFLSNIPVMGTRLKKPGVDNLEVMQYVPLVLPEKHGLLYGNTAVRHLVEQ